MSDVSKTGPEMNTSAGSVQGMNVSSEVRSLMVVNQQLAERIAALAGENERLRECLGYISFASHGCPVVIDGESVPERWQAAIREAVRPLGEAAEAALHAKRVPDC